MQPTYSGTPPSSPPNSAPAQPPPEASPQDEIQALTAKYHNLANWFYWIAGLTVASSILVLIGSNWTFAFGLGITQIIDAIAVELSSSGEIGVRIVAFIFDLVIVGIVVLFGVLANQRMRWALILGMIIYAIDGLLFLYVMDIVGILVHAFVLFCFISAVVVLSKIKKLEASLAPVPYYQPAPQEPRFFPPPR